jgi:ceramide glucosyltransferase
VSVFPFVPALGLAVLLACLVSILLTLIARLWWTAKAARVPLPTVARPVTVLKPLFGSEPRLYQNLRSFCTQDHPEFQVLFGLHASDGEALAVAERLRAEFPERDIGIVVDPAVHGINLKVSNLMNLMPHARHDWLLLADSDIEAPPDLLRRVTAPLADDAVGVVTCLYRGRAVGRSTPATGETRDGGFWARLGVQFIDDWFAPSVCLARLFGSTRYAFGATIALRRDALDGIGGFGQIAHHVADDYWLGELTRRTGRHTVLSEALVTTDVTETRLSDLAARELRWLRAIRTIMPLSYAFTFVCFPVPVAILAGAAALTGNGGNGGMDGLILTAVGVSIGARLVLDWLAVVQRSEDVMSLDLLKNLAISTVLVPLRDSLALGLWAIGLAGRVVRWRGRPMKIARRANRPSM